MKQISWVPIVRSYHQNQKKVLKDFLMKTQEISSYLGLGTETFDAK